MNAKCRLLCLREMFIKYTDQNNYVSMERIQNYLTSCGYPAHKVTIKDDIDALISSGMEIEYIHNKGYHLRSRPFSLSILKILADCSLPSKTQKSDTQNAKNRSDLSDLRKPERFFLCNIIF